MEERLVLIIDPTKAKSGAEVAQKATDKLEESAQRATKSFDRLQKQLSETGLTFTSFESMLNRTAFGSFQKSLTDSSTSLNNFYSVINSSKTATNTLITRLGSVSTKFNEMKDSAKSFNSVFTTATKAIETSANRTTTSLDNLKFGTNDLKKAFNQTRIETGKLSTRFESLYSKSGDLRDTFKQLNTPVSRATTLFGLVNTSLETANGRIRDASANTKILGQDFLTLSGKSTKTSKSMEFFRDRLVLLNKEFTPLKSNVSKMANQLDTTEGKIKDLGKAFTGLSTSMKRAASGLNAAVDRMEKLNEELDKTKKKQHEAATNSNRFSGALSGLGATIGTLGMSHMLGELVRVTDAFKAMQNKLVVVTGETDNLSDKTQILLKVSRDSRTSLEATMDVYSKLTRVNKQYGYSQEDLLKVTTTVAQAVAMSGATAQGAQGAMVQFAQALSGNFQAAAQELNSIIEQTPALADAISDGLNSTTKFANITSSQLKKLAADQKLKTRDILQGLINVSKDVNDRFQLAAKLVSQGWQAAKDSVAVYIGEVDKAYGITDKLANLLFEFAENGDMSSTMRALGAGFTVLAVGAAAAFTAIVGIPAAIATIGFAIAALGAGTIAYFFDDIVSGFKRIPLIASEAILNVFTGESQVFKTISDFFGNLVNKVTSFFSNGGSLIYNSIVNYFSKYSEVLTLSGRLIANSLKVVGSDFGIFIQGMWTALMQGIEGSLNDYLIPVINDVKKIFIDAINEMNAFFGKDLLEFKGVEDFTFSSDSQEELNRLLQLRDGHIAIGKELANTLRLNIDNMKVVEARDKVVKSLLDKSKKTSNLPENDPVDTKKLAKEMAKLEKAYQKIVGTSDEVLENQDKLSEAWDILTKYASTHKDEMIDVNAVFVKFSQEVLGVNDAIKDAKKFYADMNAEISKSNEVTQKMSEAEKHLTTLVSDGTISIKEKSVALINYRAEIDGTIDKQKDLSESITDTFMDGFEAAMEGTKSFMDFFKNALKKMAMDALKNRIVIPISNTFAGLNISGTGLGSGGLFGSGGLTSLAGNMLTGGLSPSAMLQGFKFFGSGGASAQQAAMLAAQTGGDATFGSLTSEALGSSGSGMFSGLSSSITSGLGSIMSAAIPALLATNILSDIFEGSKPTLTFAQADAGQSSANFSVTRGISEDDYYNRFGMYAESWDTANFKETVNFEEAFGALVETAFGTFGTLEGKYSKKVDEEALDAMFNFVSLLDASISKAVGEDVTKDIAESIKGIFLPEGQQFGNLDGRGGTSTPEQQLITRYSTILSQIIPEEFVRRLTDVKDLDLATFADEVVNSIYVVEQATKELSVESEALVKISDDNKEASENFIETLRRLNTEVGSTKSAFEIIGESFDFIGQAAIDVSKKVIEGAGSVADLATGVYTYSQGFVNNTEGLQFLQLAKSLSLQFTDIGYALPTTNAGFTELLQSLDLTSEAGQFAYGQLLSMSEGVLNFTNSLQSLFQGLQPLRDLAQNIREDLMSEQDLYNYRKTQAETLSDAIALMTDPSQILETSNRIENIVGSMWSSLDETQQRLLGEDFVTYLDEVTKIAEDRLSSLTLAAIDSGIVEAGISDEQIAELSIQAAENMSIAASDLSLAAQALIEAARNIKDASISAPVFNNSKEVTHA